jgi:hypothetical protein
MSRFDFILKSGAIITVKSEHCTLKHIGNELTQYNIDGLLNESDYPMYIRIEEVAAVVERAERRE